MPMAFCGRFAALAPPYTMSPETTLKKRGLFFKSALRRDALISLLRLQGCSLRTRTGNHYRNICVPILLAALLAGGGNVIAEGEAVTSKNVGDPLQGKDGGFSFTTNSRGAAAITGYTGPGGEIVIPSQIGGIPVACVHSLSVAATAAVTHITIPAGIAHLDYASGLLCHGTTLADISVHPDNPVYGSVEGVLYDRKRTSLLRYPPGRAGIYVIPAIVTNIAAEAFRGCVHLTSIAIPAGVTNIDGGAFSQCRGMTSIVVAAGNPAYSHDTEGVLFDKAKTTLITCPVGKKGEYRIPEGVTRIENGAFHLCTQLTEISIPEGVTDIGGFASCSSLTHLRIPASVTNIGPGGFSFNAKLRSVCFEGDAPSHANDLFKSTARVTVHYHPGTKGWGETFAGQPTAVWEGDAIPAPTDVAREGDAVPKRESGIPPEHMVKRAKEREERARRAQQRSPEEVARQLQQYQMELIRAGGDKGPPLPIPLTPEMEAQLEVEGVRPPLPAQTNTPPRPSAGGAGRGNGT